ncbi:MAG: helix-turn-helix domain-containing protein [Solirubrobacteraceae bacterium]|jgi:hypothetical protein
MNHQELPLERPWQALDPAVRDIVAPVIGDVAEEITAAIAQSNDEYRAPMTGAFGRGVRTAIEGTLRQFLEQIGQPAAGVRPGRDVYIALGRGEYRAGRRLDALQAAYRLGARIAWRRISAVARDAGLDAATLSLLAESIFAYIDEVSAESVEGYASEQAASAGERQRARQALVRRAVLGELDDAQAREAARAADWELPRRLAAIAADHHDAERLATLVGEGSIAARIDDLVCVLIGDPQAPGRRERLARMLISGHAALGPSVAVGELPRSWGRALRCVRLLQAGVLPAGRLVLADEALGALALFADTVLLRELAEQRLAPLEGLTPAARARLEATLLAWLRWQGNVPAVAGELHVHPQTVRYRLARLRECFGEQLDQPDARFELELALRGRAGPGAEGSN